jgi:hypothetical protein
MDISVYLITIYSHFPFSSGYIIAGVKTALHACINKVTIFGYINMVSTRR